MTQLEETVSLDESRQYCRDLTKAQAKNFYYGLKLLPEPKRSAMFALYAYMRLVDDIADREDGRSVEARIAELERWRETTHNPTGPDPLWPAFAEMVKTYAVPPRVFDAVIAGQEQDLTPTRFETFAQLEEYCYRVAGVVGLASIYVWGFEGGVQTEQMAVSLGLAFQLTNILRDLREDFERGRLYLPLEDLRAAGVTENELRTGQNRDGFERLMRFEIERAETHYRQALPLRDRVSPDSRATLVAMTEIYHRLLKKVARSPGRVLKERVSLSVWSKLHIGWQAVRESKA